MLDEAGITSNEKRFQPGSRLILTVLADICVDSGVGVGIGAVVGVGVGIGVGAGVVEMPPPPPPPEGM